MPTKILKPLGSHWIVNLLLAAFLALVRTHAAEDSAIPDLPISKSLGWGPCMDVVVMGDRLYAIGKGKLYTADITDASNPKKLGELSGLGNTRQMVVNAGVAYVSSREDGLFIVDVNDPAKPALLNHYDTVELATGLAIAGDVLFIAQRHYGVEQVDISDPKNPRFLSTIRTGEAQSVDYYDGYLYVGVWATSEVVIVDMHDARSPKVVSKTPLDGYGDGLCVHDGHLYAATGHHSRAPHQKVGDPGFGRGHGLEIFELSDPVKPAFVSRVKFPKLYHIGNDMWEVSVVNGHAFVADTHNGMFIVDVRNQKQPEMISRTVLPLRKDSSGGASPGFVGGLAGGKGVVYAAGGATDLHLIDAPATAHPIVRETGAIPIIGPKVEWKHERVIASYQPAGQVYGVAYSEELSLAITACGSAGIHVVRVGKDSIEPVSVVPTQDFTTGVSLLGNTLFAAEGTGGLSIWDLSAEGRLTRKGVYEAGGQRVRYVAVPAPGKYALLEVGSAQLQIVNVADPSKPRLALKDVQLGLHYGYQLLDQLVAGRYAGVCWHVTGLHWYDLSTDPPSYQGNHPTGRFGMTEGLVPFGDGLLATRAGGYVRFGFEESREFTELSVQQVPKIRLVGKPALFKKHLYVADRVYGTISLIDLTDPDQPKLLDSIETPGNPGRVVATQHGYLVPDGRSGLLFCHLPGKR